MAQEYDSDGSGWTQRQFYNISSNVLVGVDCAESMFQPDSNSKIPFEMVIRSLDKICEGLVLKKSSKNKIAICLFHPEEEKRVLLDFDMPFVQGINNLKKIQKCFESYSTGGLKRSFSSFILECKKKFNKVPNEGKFMFFVTNDADPSGGDARNKSLGLRELCELPDLNIGFELLPLTEDFDYQPFFAEAYQNLKRKEPKYYYTEEYLVSKINEAIKYKTANRYLRLYLGPNSDKNIFITCAQRSFTSSGKLPQKITITKEAPVRKVIVERKRNLEEEFFKLEIFPDKKIKKHEKNLVYQTPDISKGLTIIKASTKRYSKFGRNLSDPKVLKAKTDSDANFIALWESCVKDNLNLICTLKYTEFGKVRIVELIPKTINQQRHFLLISIPPTVYWPNNLLQNYEWEEIEAVESSENILKLVEYSTFDYDADELIPANHLKQVDYFKRELFGADYVAPRRRDLVTEKLYVNDVGKLLDALQIEYPEESKGPKRAKAVKPQAVKKARK